MLNTSRHGLFLLENELEKRIPNPNAADVRPRGSERRARQQQQRRDDQEFLAACHVTPRLSVFIPVSQAFQPDPNVLFHDHLEQGQPGKADLL